MSSLTMKAVLRRTGLTAHTLRAWEKRYQAVSPIRSPTKRRLYSESETLKLVLLAELVRRGHSIGKVAKLPEGELQKLLHKSPSYSASIQQGREFFHAQLEDLLSEVEAFDLAGARRTVTRIRYLTSPRDFAFEIVPQIMLLLGKRFHEKRISIAEEHAFSEVIYSHLRQIYEGLESQESPRSSNDSFLFCTREGDPHDMGLLMAAIACRYRGNTTYYVGKNLPLESLLESAAKLKPKAVILGLSTLPTKNEKISPRNFLRAIDRDLPTGISIWVGGNAAPSLERTKLDRDFWIFKKMSDLEKKLEPNLNPGMRINR